MLNYSLLALIWMADPTTNGQTKPIIESYATCSRPPALLVTRDHSSASSRNDTDQTSIPLRWLTRWEIATRNRPERSRSEREEFRRSVHESFNEHALAAIELLVGQIQQDRLREVFNWRIVENNFDEVCLEATPRDEVERLFYVSILVTLDGAKATPEKLVIVGRGQIRETVWKSNSRRVDDTIQMVRFEDDVPPAPDSQIRTANARIQ